MDYFTYLPRITYNGLETRNILTRLAVVRQVIKNYKVFYDYEVKDWERPDTIASDYYGNSDYEWLVCIPNDIMSIPDDWVKDYRTFYAYMRSNYGDVEQTKSVIHHYRYTGIGGTETADEVARKSWKMSPKTFSKLTPIEKSGWTPVYLFDYEMELNESKRKIRLISNVYLEQIDQEVKALLDE